MIAVFVAVAMVFGLRSANCETPAAASQNAIQTSIALQQPGEADSLTIENPIAASGVFTAVASEESQNWQLTAESLFLWRDNHAPAWVAGDFDVGVGPRIIVTRNVDEEWAREVEYFGVFDMRAAARQSNESFDSALGLGSRNSQYAYESALQNIEWNAVRKRNNLEVLAGFRYLRLTEEYRFKADLAITLDPLPIDSNSDGPLYPINVPFEIVRTTVRTIDSAQNNLIGGQLGLRWRKDSDRLFWEATGKAGVFANVYRVSGELTKTNPAFVGDLNFSAGLHLSDNWSLRAGYNLLWINEVALVPRQIFTYPFYTALNPADRVFLHGASVGLEAVW